MRQVSAWRDQTNKNFGVLEPSLWKIELQGDEFVESYRRARRAAREKLSGKAPPTGKGAGRGKAAGRAVAPRKLPDVMDAMMEHSIAKAFMPEGRCYLWKSRTDQSWHTKVEPDFQSCNRSLSRHGPDCLKMVITDAWLKWCLREGIASDDCPMTGLLSMVPVET